MPGTERLKRAAPENRRCSPVTSIIDRPRTAGSLFQQGEKPPALGGEAGDAHLSTRDRSFVGRNEPAMRRGEGGTAGPSKTASSAFARGVKIFHGIARHFKNSLPPAFFSISRSTVRVRARKISQTGNVLRYFPSALYYYPLPRTVLSRRDFRDIANRRRSSGYAGRRCKLFRRF